MHRTGISAHRIRQGATAGLMIALLLVGAACAGKPTTNVSLPRGVSADGVDDGVTVTGQGDVSGKPDTLTSDFGVSTTQPSVSAAVAATASTATTVVNTLKGKGVAEADIQTQNYAVFPSFTTVRGRSVPNGYTVSETLSVKLHDLAGAGAVIDAVTQTAGDSVSVQGVSFTLEDNKQLLAQARQKAWDDAVARARQLGSLSGRHLGPTQGIDETVTPFGVTGKFAASSAQAALTPIEPGQVSTSVTLTVRFALG